jgi:hypothetical protein
MTVVDALGEDGLLRYWGKQELTQYVSKHYL